MHRDHVIFVEGIHSKTMVTLTYFSKEDGRQLVSPCAPMDVGPSRRAADQSDRYHSWDYESDGKNHVLSLLPDQIIRIEATTVRFDPADFVTWNLQKSPWFLPRDWGRFS
jgi:hypothetical protein